MENEIQPNIPPVQPTLQTPAPVPSQSSINWSKNLLFIILGLIVVAGSVFAGIQIGKSQTPSQQPIVIQPTASPTQVVTNPITIPTSTTSPTINPTTNWQSYTSSKYSFSFKYPLDYKVTASPVTGNQYNVIVDQKTNTSEAGLVPIQLSINMATNESGNPLVITTIKEAETHYIKSFSSNLVTRKDITVANHPAVSITGVLAGSGPGEGSFLHYTLVQLNNEVLVIQLGNKSYQSVFDQILSTFKFTN
ncbi:MAG: hypothetical protein M1142_01425 [Patescibacteria group bacterium]|nr:hypothetical protein [Patescibacteria group bacterium]